MIHRKLADLSLVYIRYLEEKDGSPVLEEEALEYRQTKSNSIALRSNLREERTT